jgi:hypothetical protein
VFAGAALILLSGTAAAQTVPQGAVTADDIAKLDATADTIGQLAQSMAADDPTLSKDVSQSLDDLRDDITYLRVKLRKEGRVTRDEYTALRDRLETLRIKAQGDKVTDQPVPPDPVSGQVYSVPVGTQLDVRLASPLSSATAKIEQRFEATTVVDLDLNGRVVVPAGSTVRGFISSVSNAGRVDRQGRLTLSFDEIVVGGRTTRLRASVVQALEAKTSDDLTRVGAGAVVGAIIGGLLGGGKGAVVGVLVGGGGTMASTQGADVDLPAGTILRIRIDQPVSIVSGDTR